MNIENCEVLIVVDVVLDGFRLFLKLVKLHNDVVKLLLVSVQRLHYNWDDLNLSLTDGCALLADGFALADGMI
jgi:hypothetical protein